MPSGRTRIHAERPLREDLVLQTSLEAYGLVRHEGRLADRALEFTLRRKRHLYSAERREVSERVYGLLRRQRTVDHLLGALRPELNRLPHTRQDVLRFAASAVLEGGDPGKVARRFALEGPDAKAMAALAPALEALRAGDAPERLGVLASLPDSLAQRFAVQFGAEAERAAEAMNTRAPLCARVNALKIDRPGLIERLTAEGVSSHPAPLSPLGLVLDTRVNAFALPSFQEGLFELQDEGSQLLGMLVDAPPTRVVDACAGAGGKALQLAAQMANRGELFAFDVDARRLDELRRRARRAGVHNVRARAIPEAGPEAEKAISDLAGRADRVLVDAPCSGTGTFRRKPDARYRFTEEELQRHADRQRRLLAQFAPLVKPGGRLIYGTCSVLSVENEEVVEDFLRRQPAFSLKPLSALLGEQLATQLGGGDYLRLAPHRHGTDGFFGAVLIRAK